MICNKCEGNLDDSETGKPLCYFTEDIIEVKLEGCPFFMKNFTSKKQKINDLFRTKTL